MFCPGTRPIPKQKGKYLGESIKILRAVIVAILVVN